MTIRNILSALLGVVAIGASAAGATHLIDSEPARQAGVTLATTEPVGTTTAGDVRGPCDEPEHRGDPRCTGVPATTTEREPGEDVRGPCDELENRDDPRCTRAAPEDDRSGPGGDDDRSGPGDGGDDDGDDRSGSNSGRG